MQSKTTTYHLLTCLLLLLGGCDWYYTPEIAPRQLGWQPDREIAHLVAVDSMMASLEVLRTGQRIDSLLEWTDMLKDIEEEKALKYANEAYRLSVDKGYSLSQGVAMYYRALLKSKGKIIGEEIEYALGDATISQELIEQYGNQGWETRIYGLKGILYYLSRREDSTYLDSAIYYNNEAIDHLKNAKLPKRDIAYLEAQLLNDKALIYKNIDRLQSISYFKESIETAITSQNTSLLSSIWRDLGITYLYNQNYPQADSCLSISLAYAKEANHKKYIINTYQKLAELKGFLYYDSGDEQFFNESMSYLKKCLASKQKDNLFYTYELMSYNFSDKFYYTNGNPPGQYSAEADSAIHYYYLAMKEAQQEGALNAMEVMVDNITSLCRYKDNLTDGDCKRLLGNKNYNEFLNENYAKLVAQKRAELIKTNDLIRTFEKQQIEAANDRRERRNWLISGFALALAIIIFLLVLQQSQKKRFKAQMEALRAQINPHFLSNSLNAIENLVNRNERDAASKYLIHFSRLSRKILTSSRNATTTLKDELQTLKHFLALEQLRFQDKLSYDISLAKGIEANKIEVPALILQPYLENAIWHGIKPKPTPGHVSVYVERQEKLLVCTIEDDGIGREKAAALKAKSVLLSKQKSHGMQITEERLKKTGKIKGARVEIIDLKDTKGEATGTRVIVRLPFKTIHSST
jgi:anti-sigma regulatory factor (Ser/Thr protein kinase)